MALIWLVEIGLKTFAWIGKVAKLNLEEVLRKYNDLFTDELGVTAKIYVDPLTKPIFCKARSVPYMMKLKIEKELKRLETRNNRTSTILRMGNPVVPVMNKSLCQTNSDQDMG